MKLAVSTTVLMITFLATSSFAQQSTREDFREFCKAEEGRWIGDITLVTDVPGIGKNGDKVIANYEAQYAADKNLMIGMFYGGGGAGTWVLVFDPGAKQIKGLWVSSGGTVEHSIIYKKDGKWRRRVKGANADGTKFERTGTQTVTNNGDTQTWTGIRTVGGKQRDDDREVWRRVYK